MTRTTRTAATLVALVALVVGLTPPSAAQTSEIARRRQEAAALQARLEAQGERLSLADEEFNQARLDRARIERQVVRARAALADAETRWSELKSRLGKRVRTLYKHPGIWADTLLGVKSIGDLSRAKAFAGDVLLTDTDLLMETERARTEMRAKADDLTELQTTARAKEDDLSTRRRRVEAEIREQRALLAQVQGEIGELIAADERRREEAARRAAEAAERAAAEAAPAATPRAPSVKATQPAVSAPPPDVRASAWKAVETARAQLGKPYRWGAAGPDSFDCSGLTQYAWKSAGVSLPHSSRAQYASLPKVAKKDLQPGDLLFFGNPIHHVGLYEGNGVMIEAPYSGTTVRRRSIERSDFVGAARP